MKTYYVYILANRRNGTLYVGITNNLLKRVYEHRKGLAEGFTKRYAVHRLVYFESTNSPVAAIEREKQLKGGSREKKIALIEKKNPQWLDLYDSLV